jgi:hypothetical protein
MTPLTVHLIILGLLFLPVLITGFFYLHYRFFVREELKEMIADRNQISLIKVHKKNGQYEDVGKVPPKQTVNLLILGTFLVFSLLWIVHLGITSLYFYLSSPSAFMVFLSHLISLFTLIMLERLYRQR